MNVKDAEYTCDSCRNRSICKFVEDAKKIEDAYNTFVMTLLVPEKSIFSLTERPLVCPRRDISYSTQ